jgi:hypothetical protein
MAAGTRISDDATAGIDSRDLGLRRRHRNDHRENGSQTREECQAPPPGPEQPTLRASGRQHDDSPNTGQIGEHRFEVGSLAHQLPGPFLPRVMPRWMSEPSTPDPDVTLGNAGQPEHRPKGRRLARSVRTQEPVRRPPGTSMSRPSSARRLVLLTTLRNVTAGWPATMTAAVRRPVSPGPPPRPDWPVIPWADSHRSGNQRTSTPSGPNETVTKSILVQRGLSTRAERLTRSSLDSSKATSGSSPQRLRTSTATR